MEQEYNKVTIKLDPNSDPRCQHFDIMYKGEEVLGIVTYMEIVVNDKVDKQPTGEFKKDFKLEHKQN